MPLQDSDISWQMLRRIVTEWAGASAELDEVKHLDGGCVNTTLGLHLADGRRSVIKISPHRVNRFYPAEAHQLDLLRSIGIPTPQVLMCKTGDLNDPVSFLLLEFVEGINLAQAKQECSTEQFDQLQQHLADLMLLMHARIGEKYTRLNETQRREFDSWPEFYRHIYNEHWHECEKSGALPVKTRKAVARMHDRLDRLIANDDPPRLVHWDAWANNILCRADESGTWRIAALLDPNCKFAHAEAEIAYMDLFHTATPAFLRWYQRDRKLDNDYHRVRKHVYQAYELINHVNVFGGQYVNPLVSTMEKLSAVI